MAKRTERDLTAEYLRSVLHYDPATGIFTWSMARRAVSVGQECGRMNGHGYREICVRCVLRPAHRLAFLYMTGRWPVGDVDHINQVRGDNRWENLREGTRSQNSANVHISKRKVTSGLLGVVWDKARQKWRAQIRVGGTKVNLGRFDDPAIAARVYNAKAREVFGEFATINPGVDDDRIVNPHSESVHTVT